MSADAAAAAAAAVQQPANPHSAPRGTALRGTVHPSAFRTVKKRDRFVDEDSGVIDAITRPNSGPNAGDFLRERGRVPGVLYGKGGPRVLLHVDAKVLERRIKQHPNFFNRVFELRVAGSPEPYRVIPVALTRHPTREFAENITFLHWKDNRSDYRMNIPIVYKGADDCPGLRGGILIHRRRRAPVVFRGTADEIPESLTVDLAKRPLGHVTRISDLGLPDTCRPRCPADDVVSIVKKPE